MTLGKLASADVLMVIGYFVLMLGIGAYFAGRMRRMKDYFSGGNSIPWWLSGVSFYMSSFSVAAFIFYPSICYQYGWVGVTLLWVAVPATIFSVMFFGVRWRRARIDSPVEYLEARFSPLLRQLFAWQGVPVRLVDDAIKLLAVATFISVCGDIDVKYSIASAGLLILLYTLLGGLWAVAVTDFIQFVVLAVAVLIVLPLSISKAGGLGTIFQESPDGFFRLTSEKYGWSYVLPLVLLYALAWSSINWSLIQRYYCVPKEKDALKVGALVAVLYVIGPPLMFFPAIAATRFLPGVEDAGQIYPLLCAELLPPGMLGLAVAAMFAATMSSLSSEYNVCASVLTNDVYKRLICPDADQRQLVFVGRVMTLVVGLIALAVAYVMSQGQSAGLFKIMVTLFSLATAPVAVPMLVGLVSRRATNLSAVLGFAMGLLTGAVLFVWSKKGWDVQLGAVAWDQEAQKLMLGGLSFDMEILIFLSTAITTSAVMAIVCLLIPPGEEARARIEAFLTRLNTPIGELPEDGDASSEGEVASPFGVVGISILLIGVLMLAVLPWVKGGVVIALDAALGVGLALLGAGVFWMNRRQAQD